MTPITRALDEHLDAQDITMVTCAGQATPPIVAAINSVTPVHYDEFTETTSAAVESQIATVVEYVPGYRLKQQVQFLVS